MKKLLYILVALTTFGLGTTSYYFRSKIIPVPLYEVAQNAELYKWQKIHIKAYLEVHKFKLKDSENTEYTEIYSSLFDYKTICSKDCIEGASLHLPKESANDEKISSLVEELAEKNEQTNFDAGYYFAEVEITGEIEKINACFAPPYVVKAENIKQISPIRYMSGAELNKIIGRK